MATIVQRAFVKAPTQDKALQRANQEYIRRFNFGNQWTQIRLGLFCALTPNGVLNIPSCMFAFGVCSASIDSNPSAGFAALSTRNFVGVNLAGPNTTPQTMTYNAGSGNPYYSQAGVHMLRRVATATTGGGMGNVAQAIATNTGSVQRRCPIFVDITKNSPNYNIAAYYTNAANAVVDYSDDDFLSGMNQTGTPILGGVSMTAATPSSIACSEVAGNFDAINVFWNQLTFPVDIYDIRAWRFS